MEVKLEQGEGGWPCQGRRKGYNRVVSVHLVEKVSKDLKDIRELVMPPSEGKAFLAEGTACAKALRPDHTLCAQRIVWRPVCLERSE